MTEIPTTALELRSKITSGGRLELFLETAAVPEPGADEVLIRIEAAPINPSDIGLLLGPADLQTLRAAGGRVTAEVPAARLGGLKARLDLGMPVGNEGAGTVVAAGAGAEALLGRVVAAFAGGTYAQYRVAKAAECVVLPQGAAAAEGASAFVNPLTVLGMVETMRREGHAAMVHTAAASNLGQMLHRLCAAEGIPLVNIVRNAEQVRLLRDLGARHVLDSSAADFDAALLAALSETDATLAFDAIGGGTLAGRIIAGMEQAAAPKLTSYSRYGSAIHKQVYVYGGLDGGPTVVDRAFGMSWGIGGWLVMNFLQRIGLREAQRLRERVTAELKTIFASRYTAEISLAQALDPEVIAGYAKRATGEKYLINPNK